MMKYLTTLSGATLSMKYKVQPTFPSVVDSDLRFTTQNFSPSPSNSLMWEEISDADHKHLYITTLMKYQWMAKDHNQNWCWNTTIIPQWWWNPQLQTHILQTRKWLKIIWRPEHVSFYHNWYWYTSVPDLAQVMPNRSSRNSIMIQTQKIRIIFKLSHLSNPSPYSSTHGGEI